MSVKEENKESHLIPHPFSYKWYYLWKWKQDEGVHVWWGWKDAFDLVVGKPVYENILVQFWFQISGTLDMEGSSDGSSNWTPATHLGDLS